RHRRIGRQNREVLRAEQRRTATSDRGDLLHDEQGQELSGANAEASAVSATGRSNLGTFPPACFLRSLERGTLTILIRGQDALAECRFRTAHEPSNRRGLGVPAV